jgi:hypothetical protein
MTAIIAALPRENDMVRIIGTQKCGLVARVFRSEIGVRVVIKMINGDMPIRAPHKIEIYGRMRTGVVIDPGDIEKFVAGMFPGGGPSAA